MILKTHHSLNYRKVNSKHLYELSGMVSHMMRMHLLQPNKAIVGKNAFAHSSGIHQGWSIKAPGNL